ncbi:MAG TPA: TetR family transcriptional regulator C-terminal domain-containing protein [Longimicrobiales bacterium]|nr:TetR family transcriptional regulator C-terminal domain-containing protein [Longimicrobiales bacterium]
MARKRQAEEVRRKQILGAAFEVASRDGIGGLTVRGVAAEAGISHALVLFHFGRKERLVRALLDWVIGGTTVLRISDDVARFPHARDRLHALLQQEMARLSHQPQQTRLFLEFWAMGARVEPIRTQISAELERYRSAFRAIMEELLLAEPAAFAGATADGLAAVAVSWIHGCAVQAMIDPYHFDTDEYLTAVRGMIGRLR